jgi:hypothetical protein
LARSLDADDEQRDRDDGDEHERRQSYSPASGIWMVIQPNQIRFASDASCGMAAW